ncbi:MAG: DUF192 domain-containing protein [Caulobacter sp.]
MILNMRNVGRTAVLAAAMLAPMLSGACRAETPPAVAATPAVNAVVTEPLTIDTVQGTVAFKVEIADSDAEREQGLMYRTTLPADGGMLFIWDRAAPRAFWMRNTYIPLDILYIGANGRIISIAANAQPFDETPIPSRGDAKAVLELAGGRAAQLGIDLGDQVHHKMFGQ